MKNKFNFNEVVIIKSRAQEDQEFRGRKAVVRGMVENGDDGKWDYGVVFLEGEGDGDGDVVRFEEEDLHSTGQKIDSKTFETGETIKVRVDPETGEGSIVDDGNNDE